MVVTLAGYWAGLGREVTLVTLEGAGGDFYALGPGVRRVALAVSGETRSPWQALAANVGRVRALGRALAGARPQVVISHVDRTNVLTLLAARGLGVPVVVTEHTDPARYSPGRAWEILRRRTYPGAAAVVTVSQAGAEYFRGWSLRRLAVIPNPVPPAAEGWAAVAEAPVLAAMGRLAPEKGFDLLLEAFAGLAPRFPEWRLLILGEGPLRSALEAQVARLGLTGRVDLPGADPTPARRLAGAAVFVLPSRLEGFPLSLVEAMSLGLPVVATRSSPGLAEIVTPGQEGLLTPVDDAGALAQALGELMSRPELREAMGRAARRAALAYAPPAVGRRWDELLSSL
ncbi:MAG: glycosyltransferase family 4 protein [Deltaproteobacteria bacterium]|nr:glycosyltransferase family 4 protein [Deltaproteobacteria bacterium]